MYKFIVGKGRHSDGYDPNKVKPAVEEVLRSYGIPFEYSSGNDGCILVKGSDVRRANVPMEE